MSDRLDRLKGLLGQHEKQEQAAADLAARRRATQGRVERAAAAAMARLADAAASDWTGLFAPAKELLDGLAGAGIVDGRGEPVAYGYGYFSRVFAFRTAAEDAEACSNDWSSLGHRESCAAPYTPEQMERIGVALARRDFHITHDGGGVQIGFTTHANDARLPGAIKDALGATLDRQEEYAAVYKLRDEAWDIPIEGLREASGARLEFEWNAFYEFGSASIDFDVGPMLVVRGGYDVLEIPKADLEANLDAALDRLEAYLARNTKLAAPAPR